MPRAPARGSLNRFAFYYERQSKPTVGMKTEAFPLRAGRIRQGEDSRVHEVSLTRRGGIPKPLPFWERAQGRIARALGKGRLRQLLLELAAAREVFQGA